MVCVYRFLVIPTYFCVLLMESSYLHNHIMFVAWVDHYWNAHLKGLSVCSRWFPLCNCAFGFYFGNVMPQTKQQGPKRKHVQPLLPNTNHRTVSLNYQVMDSLKSIPLYKIVCYDSHQNNFTRNLSGVNKSMRDTWPPCFFSIELVKNCHNKFKVVVDIALNSGAIFNSIPLLRKDNPRQIGSHGNLSTKYATHSIVSGLIILFEWEAQLLFWNSRLWIRHTIR